MKVFNTILFTTKKNRKSRNAEPEPLETFEELGISLNEQKMLGNGSVDAIFDRVSIGTTFKSNYKSGVSSCSITEAVNFYPHLVKNIWCLIPIGDNYFSDLNSKILSCGSFCIFQKRLFDQWNFNLFSHKL